MAVAILERRPVRGISAVAERPDGSRVNFMPYPTPIFDTAGHLLGAVNMLIDVNRQPAGRVPSIAGAQMPPPSRSGLATSGPPTP